MLTVAHPWHGVHYGANAPRVVNALIEIPQGSRAKYEIDKDSGLLKLDRIIYSSFYYPCNYGFIPQTYGDDKDPLDILVITSQPVQAMCLMEAKVVGVMHMVDSGDADDKIIAVAAKIDQQMLKKIFAVILFYTAIKMLDWDDAVIRWFKNMFS